MEREFEQHILLREVSQLPEHLRHEVNMTAVLGMIAMEKVRRDAAESAKMCKDVPINLWEKS